MLPTHVPPHRTLDPRATPFHRFTLAALAMGGVLWRGQDLIMPYVHGSWPVRFGALAALVSSGMLVYGIATVVMGAFSRDDLMLLVRRRRASPKPSSE